MTREDQKSWRPIDFITLDHLEALKALGELYGVTSFSEFMRLVVARIHAEGAGHLAVEDKSLVAIPQWVKDAQIALMEARR